MVTDKPKIVTDKSKKQKGSGWRKVSTPDDLQGCLVTMLNKILMCDDPLSHAGRFASLANSWVNCRRLAIDTIEVQQVREEIAELKRQIAEVQQHGTACKLEEH
jgi:hypothetical protein